MYPQGDSLLQYNSDVKQFSAPHYRIWKESILSMNKYSFVRNWSPLYLFFVSLIFVMQACDVYDIAVDLYNIYISFFQCEHLKVLQNLKLLLNGWNIPGDRVELSEIFTNDK